MHQPASKIAVPFTLLSTLGAALFGTVGGCGDASINEADSVAASVGGNGANVAAGFQAIAPCNSATDYVTAAVVTFGVGEHRYSPPCLRLASGGTVVFLGSLLEQPLEPRDSDATRTTSNPIKSTFAGGSVEFEFPDQGFFPYRSDDRTMIGVIWASTQ